MPEKRPTAEVLDQDVRLDESLETGFRDPTSKGDLTPGRAAGVPADVSGRRVEAVETRRRAVAFDDDEAEVAAGLVAGLADLRDEIGDDEATRIAGIGDAGDGGVDDGAPDIGEDDGDDNGAPDDAAPPQTLPAVINRTPVHADPNADHDTSPIEPEWHSVKHLPGYLQSPIRAFGRLILRQFPCFERHERLCGQRGVDPLGDVAILANLAGRGPSRQAEIDAVASWVLANGLAVDATELQFPMQMPGYRPNVLVATTADETFLLVDEKRANGCPVDACYVYRWQGGRSLYLGDGGARADLGRLAGSAMAVTGPSALEPQAPQGSGSPRRDRRQIPLAPETRNTPSRAVTALRAAGFVPYGTPQGPALRLVRDDGSAIVARGEPGRPLAASASLVVQAVDPDGGVLEERTMSGAELEVLDVEGFGAGPCPAP